MQIPEGYQTVMPYLIVNGAKELQQFMTKVFNAKEKMLVPTDNGQIMHAEVFIGESVIMFADAGEQFSAQPAGLFVYVDDADNIYKKALAEGAKSVQEPADQQYGRAAGVKDKWGNSWWITSPL